MELVLTAPVFLNVFIKSEEIGSWTNVVVLAEVEYLRATCEFGCLERVMQFQFTFWQQIVAKGFGERRTRGLQGTIVRNNHINGLLTGPRIIFLSPNFHGG